jgi:DNA replication protein DnaC
LPRSWRQATLRRFPSPKASACCSTARAAIATTSAVEDVDYRIVRNLDRALFQRLIAGDWIDARDNIIFCGETGLGKSWLACALGHKACRDNRSVLYARIPKLFDELALARGDGRHARLMKTLTRVEVLILDDWGLQPLDALARQDLLEIVEERYGRRSTIVTSQPPVERWHDLIGDPTYADAILDRLVHNAHRLALDGPSMRDPKTAKSDTTAPGPSAADTTVTKPPTGAKK